MNFRPKLTNFINFDKFSKKSRFEQERYYEIEPKTKKQKLIAKFLLILLTYFLTTLVQ